MCRTIQRIRFMNRKFRSKSRSERTRLVWGGPSHQSFASIWEALADELGDRVAFVRGNEELTWTDWNLRASRLATSLCEMGVGKGDRVVLVAHNSLEMFCVFFAAFKLRAIPIALNYRYKTKELLEVLDDCEPTVAFFDTSLAGGVEGARASRSVRTWVQIPDGGASVSWARPCDELLDATPALPVERSGDDLFLQYTGGTTGKPKGVVWTHAALAETIRFLYRTRGLAAPESIEDVTASARAQVETDTTPVYMVATPLMHGAGLYGVCGQLQMSGKIVLLEDRGFDAAEFCRVVERQRVQIVVIAGDIFAGPIVDELERAEAAGEAYDVSSLELVTSGAVAWSAGNRARLQRFAAKAVLLEALGASEGGPFAVSVTLPGAAPSETSHFSASPETVLLTDDREEILAWGTPGIHPIAYGGALPCEYYKDPEKTGGDLHGDRRQALPGDGRLGVDPAGRSHGADRQGEHLHQYRGREGLPTGGRGGPEAPRRSRRCGCRRRPRREVRLCRHGRGVGCRGSTDPGRARRPH